MCLYVLRCYKTENCFSQLIFIPHDLQNKIFSPVKNISSLNLETNDRIRATDNIFLLAFKKKLDNYITYEHVKLFNMVKLLALYKLKT